MTTTTESSHRIRTSHVGSLPRPPALLAALGARVAGVELDREAFDRLLRDSVRDVVALQREHGIDIVTDGEMSKLGFFSYVAERLDGIEARPGAEFPFSFAAEQRAFPEYYERYFAEAMIGTTVAPLVPTVCSGPLSYRGLDALHRDLDNLSAALAALPGGAGPGTAFVPSIAPSGVGVNEYYRAEEDYFFAVAEAMSTEYRAIVDAGFLLQIDDPFLTEIFSFSDLTDRDRARRGEMYVAAINHGLRGIPAEKVRFHTCYSINEGPRVFDTPLVTVIDLIFGVDAGVYSFESGNPRHEHEYRVWEDVDLPDDRILMPGLVSHASNIVEHPELIAERIDRFARIVGPDRVIAGADCGFSSQATNRTEVDPTVVWAKFDALAEGARIASARWSPARAA